MEHFYQDISGFMSHKNTVMLDLVLDQFPAGGTWVELGSWTGCWSQNHLMTAVCFK